MQKSLFSLTILSYVLLQNIFADTLQQNIVEVLHTNPVIQERLKNFRATQQDLNIAEAEYYPKVDLRMVAGYNRAGEIKKDGTSDWDHAVAHSDYRNYESSLTFTQNLFNGFGTTHQVDFEESRVLAAAYKYLEKSNDIAFKMVNVYVKVLRTNELVGTARENVQINESIYTKVQALFDSGLTTDSEVKKIQATLSLARSNLSVKKNNARDAEYEYRRVLGRLPEFSKMKRPALDVNMPQSIERAALYAIEHNPSLLVSRYNIRGAESLYKQRKKDHYPTVDLEVSQTFNDNDQLGNGFDQSDDRFKARVVLSYNLFRGGADRANVQKHISKIAQEVEIERDLKRQVVEGLDLSWNAYHMVQEQLKDLKDYSQYSEKTLELYKEEYDLGRRSLLDLLSAQNDVINSRSQIIQAEYDQLFAKYRILDAMGLLVVAVNGTADEFTSKVNLQADAEAKEVLDTTPDKLDVDGDNIVDNRDLCDNSLKENNIMPYGCKKIRLDDDKDGVSNEDDECPFTQIGVNVTTSGCKIDIETKIELDVEDEITETNLDLEEEIDNDNDGIKDSIDVDTNTPEGYQVDKTGQATALTLLVNFQKNSISLPTDLDDKIIEFAEYLKKYPELKANIVGHTSRTKVSGEAYNLTLSKQRAKRVALELEKYGISSHRLSFDGKGFAEPIADNATEEGRIQNRRVEIELIKDGLNPPEFTSEIDESLLEETFFEDDSILEETAGVDTSVCSDTLEGFSIDEDDCSMSKSLYIDFASNSSYLPNSSKSKVNEMTNLLQGNPSYSLEVIGHTSTDGTAKYNKWISQKRANRFMEALVNNGIDSSRISSEGRGEEEPIVINDWTLQEQRKNRRIELKIISEEM